MAIQALVMGFGGTGSQILTNLKEQAVLKYGKLPPEIRFLQFDTIADWQPNKTVRILGGEAEETLASGNEEGTSLDPSKEYFFLGDRDPDLKRHVYEFLSDAGDPERYPHLEDWLHAPWLRRHVPEAKLNILEGAAQQRQIGRFAMFQNADKVVQQVQKELRNLSQLSRGAAINVWLVGSSAGGTGAGCLLDAAFLSRLAAGRIDINLSGVIVLPEIYDDKDGIAKGRAYSLFRELDRLQELGIPDRDHYSESGQIVSSKVDYDARGQLRSAVPSRLFDTLFYVGQPCHGDDARKSFFSSVATSIDPYLDESAGPPLLEASVNDVASASAFGGARLYLPIETLGALFAWQEVASYLRAACAPVGASGREVTDLAHGAVGDRQRGARAKTENLLPLFKEVLALKGTDDALRHFAQGLSPTEIVKKWYGVDGAVVAGLSLSDAERMEVKLTCVDPTVSFTEEDSERVSAVDRVTQTYNEYRAASKEAKKPKESKAESRDRFAEELERVIQLYKDAEGADRSFEKGRRRLFAKISGLLSDRVDALLLQELEQNPRFAVEAEAAEQGTVLTRLYQELKEILADGGPLALIDGKIGTFLDAMSGDEEQQQHEAVRAIKDLKEWQPSGLFGGSVDEPQQAARESVARYLLAFQRRRLLQDMQRLVRQVRERLETWARSLRGAFQTLVLHPATSAFAAVSEKTELLEGRLARLALNPTARISCSPDWDPRKPDIEMMGFRDDLHEHCTKIEGQRLHAQLLAGSRWQLELDEQKQPRLRLVIQVESDDRRETIADGDGDLRRLHEQLYDYARSLVDERLATRDIFDYLSWVDEQHSIGSKEIAEMLRKAAEPLLNAKGREFCHLVVKDPGSKDKRLALDSLELKLQEGLGGVSLSRMMYSDPYSINVFKILKPNLDDIVNITDCRDDYIVWQQESLTGDEGHDKKLLRAQVYHPFRPEMEAWYIERRFYKQRDLRLTDRSHIPPRIVRLLEEPEMMRVFVLCIATGAIERTSQEWLWHGPSGALPLNDAERDPGADLNRAAVVFTLQQREATRGGLRRIDARSALESARGKAQSLGRDLYDLVKEFLDQKLEAFLREHLPLMGREDDHELELAGWRMIFEFYSHPDIRTHMSQREDLHFRN